MNTSDLAVVAVCDRRSQNDFLPAPSVQSVASLLLRGFLERRNRLVDHNPRQFIFEEDRFLWRKRCGIVKRRDRDVDRV